MEFTDEHGKPLSEGELRDLAAYADGTLEPKRSDAIAQRIGESPVLAALVDDQLRALDAVHASAVAAPASLRAAIDAQREPDAAPRRAVRVRARGPWRPGVARGGALAGALAAVAAALAIVLSGGASTPSVAQAAALAGRGVALPAPAQDSTDRQLLASAVDGVHYPYWEDFGWRSTGARHDRIGARPAITVYYVDGARRAIAYTIVGGSALSVPASATSQILQATRFAVFQDGSRTVVTWLRHGHSCVLSSVSVPANAMLSLAAWHGQNGALAAWDSEPT